jgi:hypothetical protein
MDLETLLYRGATVALRCGAWIFSDWQKLAGAILPGAGAAWFNAGFSGSSECRLSR